MRELLLSVVVALASYLLGCISTGIVISRGEGVNIRERGSKSTGATNVTRVLGLKKGLVTFIGDFMKAALSCLLGYLLLPGATFGVAGYGTMLGGLFAILGHNWPVFYGFKGGKGVACSVAVVLFVNPLWGAVSIAACLLVIALTRYISLGSLTLLLSFMVLMCIEYWGDWPVCLYTVALFALCAYRHRANIARLIRGTESRFGEKAGHDKNGASEESATREKNDTDGNA